MPNLTTSLVYDFSPQVHKSYFGTYIDQSEISASLLEGHNLTSDKIAIEYQGKQSVF